MEDTYTRNRIRNHVIPYFTGHINSKTVAHINGAMEQLREIQRYLERQMKTAYRVCVREEKAKIHIYEKEFRQQDELICGMILRQAMVCLGKKEKDLDEVHVTNLRELMEKQVGRKIDLPYRMRAIRTYDGIDLFLENTDKGNAEEFRQKDEKQCVLPLDSEDETVVRYGEWTIACRKFPFTQRLDLIPKKTYTKWFDYDIIKENVSVRGRRSGDKIVIDSKGNSQKLKSYFVNEKIPAREREKIPLIAEDENILWIVGYRQSKAYQVTEQTKTVLEITINGGT